MSFLSREWAKPVIGAVGPGFQNKAGLNMFVGILWKRRLDGRSCS